MVKGPHVLHQFARLSNFTRLDILPAIGGPADIEY